MKLRRQKNIVLGEMSAKESFDLALVALKKPAVARNPKDIAVLMKITQNIPVFEKEDFETQEKLLHHLQYRNGAAGKEIFKYGDVATHFYIILKGTVGIYIPDEINPGQWREVREESDGDYFGELALISNKPRSATVISKTECHLAVMEKQPYKQILKQTQERELFAKLQFLFSLKPFNKYNFNLIRKLYMNSEPAKHYIRNQIIFEEGAPAAKMYIILAGEFKVTKDIEIHVNDHLEQPPSTLSMFQNRGPTKLTELAILTTGEIFGDDDLFLKRNHFTTVTCETQQGICLEVKKEDFEAIIMVEDSSRRWLQTNLEFRSKLYQDQISSMIESTKQNIKYLVLTKPVTVPLKDEGTSAQKESAETTKKKVTVPKLQIKVPDAQTTNQVIDEMFLPISAKTSAYKTKMKIKTGTMLRHRHMHRKTNSEKLLGVSRPDSKPFSFVDYPFKFMGLSNSRTTYMKAVAQQEREKFHNIRINSPSPQERNAARSPMDFNRGDPSSMLRMLTAKNTPRGSKLVLELKDPGNDETFNYIVGKSFHQTHQSPQAVAPRPFILEEVATNPRQSAKELSPDNNQVSVYEASESFRGGDAKEQGTSFMKSKFIPYAQGLEPRMNDSIKGGVLINKSTFLASNEVSSLFGLDNLINTPSSAKDVKRPGTATGRKNLRDILHRFPETFAIGSNVSTPLGIRDQFNYNRLGSPHHEGTLYKNYSSANLNTLIRFTREKKAERVRQHSASFYGGQLPKSKFSLKQ